MPATVEVVLSDFRTWLQEVARAGQNSTPGSNASASSDNAIDLHTLLGQFVALRHEVNLQTRATRSQQEQNAETLSRLSEALDALQQAPTSAGEADLPQEDELLRPLLKTLVDLYDALALAAREMQRVQQVILPALDQVVAATSAASPAPLALKPVVSQRSVWARWFGGPDPSHVAIAPAQTAAQVDSEQQHLARQAVERVRQVFDSMATGYTMSVQRVDRALQQHGLEPMACVGQPFDPEEMEVVEVVSDSNRPASEVIEEVRRGYRWQGRIFRFAQVRVARPQ